MPADGPGVTTDDQSAPQSGDASAGDPSGSGRPAPGAHGSASRSAPAASRSAGSEPTPAQQSSDGGNGRSSRPGAWPDPVSPPAAPAGRGAPAPAAPVPEAGLPSPTAAPVPSQAHEQGLPAPLTAPASAPAAIPRTAPGSASGSSPRTAPGPATGTDPLSASAPITGAIPLGSAPATGAGAITAPGPVVPGGPPPAPVLVPADAPRRFRRGQHARPRRARGSKRGLRVTQRLWSISPWSVFKVSALFYLCMGLVILVAGTLLYNAGRSVGTIDQFESFVTRIGAYGQCVPTAEVPEGTVFEEDTEKCNEGEVLVGGFALDDGTLFRAAAITGGILVVAGSIGTVLLTVLVNLLNELTGGLRHTIIREPVVRPEGDVARRPGPARRRAGPRGPTGPGAPAGARPGGPGAPGAAGRPTGSGAPQGRQPSGSPPRQPQR